MPPKEPLVIHEATTTFEAQLILEDLKSAGVEAELKEVSLEEDGTAVVRHQIVIDRGDEEKTKELIIAYQPDVEEDDPEPSEVATNEEQSSIKEVDSPFSHPAPHSKAGDTILFGGVILMVGLAILGMAAAIVALVLK